MTLNYFAFQPTIWLILGAILLSFELLDGSFSVFLPSGLGAWLTAALLKLQLTGLLFDLVVFDDWSDLLLGFAIASIVAIGTVRIMIYRKRSLNPAESDDINQY